VGLLTSSARSVKKPREVEHLAAPNAAATAAAESLEKASQLEEQCERIQADLRAQGAELDAARASEAASQQELSILRGLIADKDLKLDVSCRAVSDTKLELFELSLQLQASCAENERLQADVASVKGELSTSQQQHQHCDASILAAQQSTESLRLKLTGVGKELLGSASRIRDLEQELAAIRQLSAAQDKHEVERRAREAQLYAASQRATAQQSAMAEEKAKLAEELGKTIAENKRLQLHITSLPSQEEYLRLAQQKHSLVQQIERLQWELRDSSENASVRHFITFLGCVLLLPRCQMIRQHLCDTLRQASPATSLSNDTPIGVLLE
jgi:chromosome segregation ATPase